MTVTFEWLRDQILMCHVISTGGATTSASSWARAHAASCSRSAARCARDSALRRRRSQAPRLSRSAFVSSGVVVQPAPCTKSSSQPFVGLDGTVQPVGLDGAVSGREAGGLVNMLLSAARRAATDGPPVLAFEPAVSI